VNNLALHAPRADERCVAVSDRFLWRPGPQRRAACEACGITIVHRARAGAQFAHGEPVAFEAFAAAEDSRSWRCNVCTWREDTTFELPDDGPLFHLTSPANRASIAEHGLDWTRMGAAPGIAGFHREPELAGIFLTEWGSVSFFAGFRVTIDVWAVERPAGGPEEGPDGWLVSREPISASRIRLVQIDDWLALDRPRSHAMGWEPPG
jgi:hypothetical protein